MTTKDKIAALEQQYESMKTRCVEYRGLWARELQANTILKNENKILRVTVVSMTVLCIAGVVVGKISGK